MPMKEIDHHEYSNPGLIVLLSNSQPLAPIPQQLNFRDQESFR